MPLREINEKFTISELVLLSWRGEEQAYNTRVMLGKAPSSHTPDDVTESASGKRKYYNNVIGPNNMPDKYFVDTDKPLPSGWRKGKDKYGNMVVVDGRGRLISNEGDFNLGLVSGEEARKYLGNLGIPFPIHGELGITLMSEDEETDKIRETYKGHGRRT